MQLRDFGSFARQFGLVKGSCEAVSQGFIDWQRGILPVAGHTLTAMPMAGPISGALQTLLPRTAPIITRYLFWPLNEEWTLYFDNGRPGTDASPPCVLASRLHTEGIRITLADHKVDRSSKKVLQYGGTIFEYFENKNVRRSVFAVNDGGKWVFGQDGTAFDFEDESAYSAHLVRDRLPASLLLSYLDKLNANLDGSKSSSIENGPGKLLVKSGRMPHDFTEFPEDGA